jgi:uncharacterized protein YbjT (DUF2867 family)
MEVPMQDQAAAPAAQRVALLAGATGLVGREVLAALLTDKRYAAVHCVSRRALKVSHPKLFNHVVDLTASMTLSDIPRIDDVVIALGTTIKVAGSQQAFRAVDFDAVLAVARAGRARGATRLSVVSAMGANAKSSIFYNRVKGEMEAAVTALGYPTLIIARPSMLLGDRQSLAQPTRPGERFWGPAMTLLKPLIPANYQAINAAQVARALLGAMHDADPGTRVLLSGELQQVH